MLKYYSTVTDQFYDTEEQAFEAERRWNEHDLPFTMMSPVAYSTVSLLQMLKETSPCVVDFSDVHEHIISIQDNTVTYEYKFQATVK